MSRMLFVSIYKCRLAQLKDEVEAEELTKILRALLSSAESILKSSTQYNAAVIACLLVSLVSCLLVTVYTYNFSNTVM